MEETEVQTVIFIIQVIICIVPQTNDNENIIYTWEIAISYKIKVNLIGKKNINRKNHLQI